MTDKLEKMIQQSAKLELLLMLQNEVNKCLDVNVRDWVTKFVEENK